MVFFLCFFTFVQMFFIILNNSVFGFHNLVLAVETCFSMILGKFQFDEMKEIGVFVTVMFFVFVICSSWVLINLLLTVVIQTFVEVRHALEKRATIRADAVPPDADEGLLGSGGAAGERLPSGLERDVILGPRRSRGQGGPRAAAQGGRVPRPRQPSILQWSTRPRQEGLPRQ
nr:polycystin-2-like isoform X1 [Penaeus vannamei]